MRVLFITLICLAVLLAAIFTITQLLRDIRLRDRWAFHKAAIRILAWSIVAGHPGCFNWMTAGFWRLRRA